MEKLYTKSHRHTHRDAIAENVTSTSEIHLCVSKLGPASTVIYPTEISQMRFLIFFSVFFCVFFSPFIWFCCSATDSENAKEKQIDAENYSQIYWPELISATLFILYRFYAFENKFQWFENRTRNVLFRHLVLALSLAMWRLYVRFFFYLLRSNYFDTLYGWERVSSEDVLLGKWNGMENMKNAQRLRYTEKRKIKNEITKSSEKEY